MKNLTLKPCPFCGSEARLVHTPDDEWYVDCADYTIYGCACLPSTWFYSTEEEAIKEWNRRAKDE